MANFVTNVAAELRDDEVTVVVNDSKGAPGGALPSTKDTDGYSVGYCRMHLSWLPVDRTL